LDPLAGNGPRLVKPLVIAHRGASGVEYENSRAAFLTAGRLGADGVELDVHAARDGTLVVHHDPRVDGHLIAGLGADELAELRLPNGEPLPTLADALAAIDPRLRVFVEVKTLPPGLDASLLSALDHGPNPGGYAVHGFDHRIVRRLGQRRPTLARGVLSCAYPVHPLAALDDTGAAALWQDAGVLDADLVGMVHAAGSEIIVWTVNEDEEMVRCLGLGVDAICTNYPDRGRRVVDRDRS
jgi:glycerophosphoryl diester phosphodiesterase